MTPTPGSGGSSDLNNSVDPDDLSHPEFLPDPSLSRAEMESLQRELAATATFADELGFDPTAVAIDAPVDLTEGLPPAHPDAGDADVPVGPDPDAPVVVGVDQAFRLHDGEDGDNGENRDDGDDGDNDGGDESDERDVAVSAAVAIRDGVVIEYASATRPLSIPYIPGLLAFREGEAILAALDALSVEPDLLVCDGSGRIHFREAGIATHVGVIRDVPSVGVAKNLLCGEPAASTETRPQGWRTPIRANETIETAESGTVVGHAFQSRQYPNSRRVNPLYVSPGHRVSATTTVELVDALCAGYKLPEPTRLADAYADVVKRDEG